MAEVGAGEGESGAATAPKSKHGIKFDEMIRSVRNYSMAQVMCLEDDVTRKIIQGLIDGSRVPEVEEAFRVLYEDYPPIRLAGNLLFDMIDRAVSASPGTYLRF
jgi:hypothetical protein